MHAHGRTALYKSPYVDADSVDANYVLHTIVINGHNCAAIAMAMEGNATQHAASLI